MLNETARRALTSTDLGRDYLTRRVSRAVVLQLLLVVG